MYVTSPSLAEALFVNSVWTEAFKWGGGGGGSSSDIQEGSIFHSHAWLLPEA